MMPQQTGLVGLDVSKRKIDACIYGMAERCTAPSTPEGEAELIAWLRRHGVSEAVMEASGGYEQRWAEALRRAGFAVRIVDPRRVRYFAKSAGRLAKTDAIDAAMIAWFGVTFPANQAGLPPEPERRELDQLITARAALLELDTALANRDEHEQPALVAKAQAAVRKTLHAQAKKLDKAIAAAIAKDPATARRAEIITSVPGLGPQAAAGLIAWLPELGHVDDKAIAALVGVAPYDDDSGERRGERHIKGGREKLRNLLYMPTLTASTQCNPVLKPYYQRLRAKGKEAKVALVACMHKLMRILNTMLARDETWNPPIRAAA
jgi:transposase